MTNEEILQLAQEKFGKPGVDCPGYCVTMEELIAFANAIENRTLERAAGICDVKAEYHRDVSEPQERTAMNCAAAIRENGNQKRRNPMTPEEDERLNDLLCGGSK